MYESLLYTSLDPELKDLFVALRTFSLHITSGRLESILPRSLDAGVLFETIG